MESPTYQARLELTIDSLRSRPADESIVTEALTGVLNENAWTDGTGSTDMVPSTVSCYLQLTLFDRKTFRVSIDIPSGIQLRQANAFHRWSERVAVAIKRSEAFNVLRVDYQVCFSSWVDTV